MVFENCDHLETEIRNATDTYTGDTCCKNCGKVMATGQTVKAKIPEGGTYYVGVTSTKTGDYSGATATYTSGQEFPETVNDGDVYVYGDYEYRYNFNTRTTSTNSSILWYSASSQNGWGVRVRSTSQATYGTILESINSQPITSMSFTFAQCRSLNNLANINIPSGVTSLPNTFYYCKALVDTSNFTIPSHVTNLYWTFKDCTSLLVPPVIPNSVTTIEGIFYNCTSLSDLSTFVIPNSVIYLNGAFRNTAITNDGLPTIPNSVQNMMYTFYGCKNLTDLGDLAIPNTVTSLFYTFYDCTSLKTAPVIPSAVSNMGGTFHNCTSLTGIININANPTDYSTCFYGVDFEAQNLTLAGTCVDSKLDILGSTSANYCTECNGKHTKTNDSHTCHGGETATCTQKSICARCDKEYGYLGEHAVSNGQCTECGKTVTVIESAHSPYESNQNYVSLGTWDYTGAKSVTITITYQTVATYDWFSIVEGTDYVSENSQNETRNYLSTSGQIVNVVGNSNTVRFTSTTKKTITFENIDMLTGSVILRTYGSGKNSYGAKVQITPNY